MRSHPVIVTFSLATFLAACHGGGTSGMPTAAGSSGGPGSAAFTVNVPPQTSSSIEQSAVVTLLKVNGNSTTGSPVQLAMNLTVTTPGCTAAQGGGLTCIMRITVPSGQDTFSVATYTLPNSGGTQLSNDQVTTAISAAKQTSCIKSPSPAVAPAAPVNATVRQPATSHGTVQ